MKLIFVIFNMLVVLAGCATESVVSSPTGTYEGIVHTGSEKLSPGDRVSIFEEACKKRFSGGKMRGMKTVCTDTKIGSGEIFRRISENEVLVRSDTNVTIRKGLEIRKE